MNDEDILMKTIGEVIAVRGQDEMRRYANDKIYQIWGVLVHQKKFIFFHHPLHPKVKKINLPSKDVDFLCINNVELELNVFNKAKI